MTTIDAPEEKQTKLIGANSLNPLPIVNKLWEFYSTKSIKTVFISVGTSSSPIAELEIGETLGCPLHIIEYNKEKLQSWEKVVTILNSRKESDETRCDFTKDVVNKWILGKNLRISNSLPFFYDGTIDLSGESVQTIKFERYVQTICDAMNIPVENQRLDLLNIQINDSTEIPILFSLLNSKFRPGLIIVNYTNSPDTNIYSTQVAGHLQNVGYMLMEKEGSKFLYMYNDKNVYEFCSYENTKVDNPLVYELVKSTGFYNKTSDKKVDA
uniref:Uncharacterized protein n=1 Tax=viral metagenome TaxID=1070528 RepID=A0A6C0D7K3_9ZZZZ